MAVKLLKQMEMFDEMTNLGLTPNQYYLLCCIRDNISPLKINTHLELRNLMSNGWLTKDNKLTPQSQTIIKKIEKLFVISSTRTATQLMGKDYKKNIERYTKMFPNIKLPSGKAARSSIGNLSKTFKWFFENHKYSWDEVFVATAVYVNEGQAKQWKFMRTSQYFIRKDNLSDLADFCEVIKTGGYEEERALIKTNVV
jgi:hypothetical protein